MKITDVQVIRMTLPTDSWMLLKIETDQGIEGWGDVTGSCDDDGLAGIMQDVREMLIGKNPLHIQECNAIFYDWRYPSFKGIRTYATARSGIDQALWDVTARYYKLPLYRLYGADGKREIPLYANLNKAIRSRRSPEVLRKQGEKAASAGFSVVKCTPFDEINPLNADNDFTKALERLEALMDVMPIERVAIDCHQRFESFTLARMAGYLLKKYGIPYWIEDPVEIWDHNSMRVIRQRYPEIRWAAGEDAFHEKQAMEIISSGCYDIFMPDVKYIGGPSVVKALIPVVEGCNGKVTLHNPNGVIATAHSAHLSALSRSTMPMEFPFEAVIDRELLCSPTELIRDGKYVLSDEPGIGVTISEQALKEYGARFVKGQWEGYDGDQK